MNNYPAQNYYSKHIQKKDYDNAFREARQWAIESGETAITAARVYHVKEDALRQSVHRLKKRTCNSDGTFNTWGGNNRILSEEQEEAVRQYCYEQWEMGLGASHAMDQAAIAHLRAVSYPLLSRPVC